MGNKKSDLAEDVSTASQSASAASKTLIIAEKPSVARDIVSALTGKFSQEKGYWESENYIVSHAIGHLLTIAEPAEIDEKFKGWSIKTLPILPEHYLLKPISAGESQLKILKKLILRKDVKEIINACDAGREGELIFRYIFEYIQSTAKKNTLAEKKLRRLWLQSMTKQSIVDSFKKLRNDEEMLPLANAARSRSEADWVIGINSSRGLTVFNSRMGGFQVTPCGRVQTPTLSMIVKREKDINAFKPHTYFIAVGEFENDSKKFHAKWSDPKFKKDPQDHYNEKKADRIFDKEKVEEIVKKCAGQPAIVEEEKKKTTEKSPQLYDLTSLQREGNMRFGFSAKQTLAITQTLYERHKLITYPRTDAKYLPNDYLAETPSVMQTIAETKNQDLLNLKPFLQKALKENYIKFDPRIFDDKKISDHHAIIPTKKAPGKLDEAQLKVYRMILERFLAVFFPAAQYDKVNRKFTVQDEVFRSEGKVLVVPGWRAIYGKQKDENLLESLNLSSPTKCTKVEKEEHTTKPPARYNEASLLSAMESAGKQMEEEALRDAMRDRGLGTPATRAAIIEKLKADRYIVKEDRDLIPTTKATELFSLINAMKINELNSPELTGQWEHKLSLIEKGELSRKEFMNEINKNTETIVSQIKNYNEDEHKVEASFSPINGVKFYEYLTRYANEDKSIVIKKIIGGRLMTSDEVYELITKKRIGPFENFRSKKGRSFPASIVLDDENKVKLVFLNQEEDDEEFDYSKAELVGHFFADGSEVYKTLTAYVTKSYLQKEGTGFRLSRVILGKEISDENIKKMINGEKSDLIQGFRSSRTNRLFDAWLELTETGKMRFSFPPRKSAKKKP